VDRRAQLQAVALDLFDERGVRGASMRELARRAGVDVRSAYYHFESKRDLLRSLFDWASESNPQTQPIAQEILEALQAIPPADALGFIIEGNLALLQERARFSRLIHAEVLYGDEDAKAVGEELWQGWGQQLEVVLLAGGVADAETAAPLARFLRSLLWGVFNESQLTGELVDPAKCKARAQELTKLVLAGCRLPNARQA